MNKEWQQLTREEKREHRVNKWISPSDIEFKSPEAEKNYRDRANRIYDALSLREPDRVPVSLPVGNFPAYYSGKNLRTVMYDYDELIRVWSRFLHDFYDDISGGGSCSASTATTA